MVKINLYNGYSVFAYKNNEEVDLGEFPSIYKALEAANNRFSDTQVGFYSYIKREHLPLILSEEYYNDNFGPCCYDGIEEMRISENNRYSTHSNLR